MSQRIAARLAELGLTLPPPAPPAGAYAPFVVVGDLVFVSGQLPLREGEMRYRGHVGQTLTLEEGYAAARLCGLNLIAQVKAACDGDLDRVQRVIRLAGYVASPRLFSDHPKVLNGASELMVAVFGEAGRHARVALGAASLPLDAAVEIEGMFQISRS